MALISCPECGREISDKATACPGCGCPVSAFSNTSDLCDVILPLRVQEDKRDLLAKTLASQIGLPYTVGTALIANAPIALKKNISREEAEQIKSVILSAGVPVKISSHGEPVTPMPPPKGNTPYVPRCPKCGSSSIQLVKKGFSVGKAVAGTLLFGPAGAIGGAIGSNKMERVCAACKHRW